ncbi:TPA: hypothetical protein DDZ10_03445 [Candidatus Uhrbacteria bacterium]|nr:MAG: hypothetical protein A3D69_02910 [Candidatus Uhrbacteria bacterium RIFCSPHIGHO2_02_FULL_54_11]HBL39697.1 hypothetical protein [Candidatus Uhrbacteria bacterium]
MVIITNISAKAEHFVKANGRELIRRFANPDLYTPSKQPTSVFMAGSPGAGKTEVSKRLIERFADQPPVRIDADEIRELFEDYDGANAHLFQNACTIGVNKLLDYVIAKNINFILDGTFAYAHAMKNIERSLNHERQVVIYYIFQSPSTAWKFTQAREINEGRRVTRDVFINAFLAAQKNVTRAKLEFQDRIELNLIVKNFTSNKESFFSNIDCLDLLLPEMYSREELEKIL